MKKLTILLMGFSLTLLLSSCGINNQASSNNQNSQASAFNSNVSSIIFNSITGTNQSSSTASSNAVISSGNANTVGLYSISFVSDTTGFGLSSNNYSETELYKTIDSGRTWEYVTTSQRHLSDLDFVSIKIGLAIESKGYQQYVLDKTTDGGKTWVNITPNLLSCSSINIYFMNQDVGWAICFDGDNYYIFKTISGGTSWIRINTILKSDQVILSGPVYFLNQSTGWIVGMSDSDNKNLFKTTDGGKTFKAISHVTDMRPFAVGIHFSDENTGIIAASEGAGGGENYLGIEMTNDGGKTYKTVYQIQCVDAMSFPSKSIGYALVHIPTDPNGEFIIRTIDGGKTWNRMQ